MAGLPKGGALSVEMAWKLLHDVLVFTQPQRIRKARASVHAVHVLMRRR